MRRFIVFALIILLFVPSSIVTADEGGGALTESGGGDIADGDSTGGSIIDYIRDSILGSMGNRGNLFSSLINFFTGNVAGGVIDLFSFVVNGIGRLFTNDTAGAADENDGDGAADENAAAEEPESFTDKLIKGIGNLFVPEDDFFPEKYRQIKEAFEEKIPIAAQVSEIVAEFIEILENADSTPPNFEFELYGAKMTLFDYEAIDPYVKAFQGLLVALIYVRFIWSLYKKMPSIIKG